MANYSRELRMEADIRKNGKIEKATEFVEKIKKKQEKDRVVLKKAQVEMKQQLYRRRKKAKEWKKEDKVMLSTKDLVFKERSVKKLVNQYVSPFFINKVVSTNVVKLQLPTSMRIHLVVNIS